MSVAITKDAVVIDGILLDRTHYDILTELAALMGDTIQDYISQALKCDIEMALDDHAALGALLVKPWKEMLGKQD